MKLIKKVKYFPTGSCCIWLNRFVETREEIQEIFNLTNKRERLK